ncbi:MAG: hypothetical protein J6Y07_04075 [Alphaproteobacteria bacterium]|nr:hypothetical protein [Alphaproteobacteria bacterium]
MRKISYIIIALVGMIGKANAVSDEVLIQQLVDEKNQKLVVLEQCTKKVTGFKVAGISTLGLTAVGVAGNIALKNKNKEMDGQITFAKNELARQQEKTKDSKTLAERQADCEAHKDIAKWDGKTCTCLDTDKNFHEGKCWAKNTDCFVLHNVYNFDWNYVLLAKQKEGYNALDKCDKNYLIPFLREDESQNLFSTDDIRKRCKELCCRGTIEAIPGKDAKETFAVAITAEILYENPALSKCLQENPEQMKLFGSTLIASLPHMTLYSCHTKC